MPEPSPYFRQHHGLEPPAIDLGQWRPYWRVRTRLDRLLLDGAITTREWLAAVRLRGLMEAARAALLPVHSWDREPHGRSSGPAMARRISAAAQLEHVRAAIGAFSFWLLEACLVDDASWRYLGGRFAVDPKTVRAWTIAAIHRIAGLGEVR